MKSLRPRFAIVIALFLGSAFVADAQSGTIDLPTQVEIQFGSKISFASSIESAVPIARAVLFLRPLNSSETHLLDAGISAKDGSFLVASSMDMRPPIFDPFSVVSYWWQIEYADGSSEISASQEFRYEDNRFDWQTMISDQISINWVEGGASRGEELLSLTTDALDAISRTLGLLRPGHVAIYVYPSTGDLLSGLQIGGAPWIEGHSIPELGVILLARSDDTESIIALEREIPHELTHLLLYERMQEQYTNLPAWLSEGLSTLQEGQANPAYRFELERALEADSLLTIESLCASFPISEHDAFLAYAQSASFTQYLLDVYGMGGILKLLDAYQEGASCTGAVQRIYQRPLSQLESEWRVLHLESPTSWQKLSLILPWSLILLLVLMLVLIGLSARKRRSRHNKD